MITIKMGIGETRPYVTHKAHGIHPAGSSCAASRNLSGALVLEFPDGDVVALSNHYAAGIEDAVPTDGALWLAS